MGIIFYVIARTRQQPGTWQSRWKQESLVKFNDILLAASSGELTRREIKVLWSIAKLFKHPMTVDEQW